VKDDRVYLKHILRRIARIQEYTSGGRESFLSSPLIQDGVIRNLQTLAESSQHLSEGIKASQSSVDLNGYPGGPFRSPMIKASADCSGLEAARRYRIRSNPSVNSM
jgi:hypothetical protein